jgi:hypothetical protein
MNVKYVEDHTIFECIVGSHAYGINTQESDIDKAGVMITDKSYIYGLNRFDQFQNYPNEDKTIYDFRKAIRLISDNNPNMLDLIYTPDRCVLKLLTPWQEIIDNRHLFISKKAKFTFSGYAIAQLERIKTHRSYLLNPPKKQPERSDFGLSDQSFLPTTQLKALINSSMNDFLVEETKEDFFDALDAVYGDYIIPLFWKFTKENLRPIAMEWLQAGLKSNLNCLRSLGPTYIKEEYLDLTERELAYYCASHEWQRYQQWSKTRNKKRADLEIKFGYDTKHGAHLVRLMRMGAEILQTGQVNVDRTNIDADELKAIKRGDWSYEQLEKYAKNMDEILNELYKTSKLQKTSDVNAINELCIDIIDRDLNILSTTSD